MGSELSKIFTGNTRGPETRQEERERREKEEREEREERKRKQEEEESDLRRRAAGHASMSAH